MKQPLFEECDRSRLGVGLWMRRPRSGMLLGAAIVAWLVGGRAVCSEAREAQPAGSGHHCLWRADGEHCSVYLLGSIHFLKPDNYPLAAPIEGAFTRSQIVLFETDIGQMQDPATQGKVLTESMLPNDQTLEQQISPATFLSFSNHAADSSMPLMLFTHMKPALAAMTLELLEIQKLGFDPNQGVDIHFYNLAKEKGKTIVPLETIDFQLGLLTGFSKEEGELMMKSTLEEIDTTKKLLGEMIGAWRVGDAAAMEKLLNPMEEESPAIFKRLVTDRSHQWALKVEDLLRGNKTALMVVGAGHLVGKEGLVELLRAKGARLVQE